MATQEGNYVMNGVSGQLADQLVFKHYGQKKKKKTVITRVAAKRAYDSPAQVAAKKKFALASAHAVGMLYNPVIKDYYAARTKGHETPYDVAIHDIYDIPVIEYILTNEYNGRGGSRITFFAQKNNFIKDLLVTIKDANGVVIESGYAVQVGKLTEWNYTATQHNPAVAGCIITAEAVDYAGNKEIYSKTIIQQEKTKQQEDQQQGYTRPDQHYLTPITSLRLLPDVFMIPYAEEYGQKEAKAARERDVGPAENTA